MVNFKVALVRTVKFFSGKQSLLGLWKSALELPSRPSPSTPPHSPLWFSMLVAEPFFPCTCTVCIPCPQLKKKKKSWQRWEQNQAALDEAEVRDKFPHQLSPLPPASEAPPGNPRVWNQRVTPDSASQTGRCLQITCLIKMHILPQTVCREAHSAAFPAGSWVTAVAMCLWITPGVSGEARGHGHSRALSIASFTRSAYFCQYFPLATHTLPCLLQLGDSIPSSRASQCHILLNLLQESWAEVIMTQSPPPPNPPHFPPFSLCSSHTGFLAVF